jgi:hypothetical protein
MGVFADVGAQKVVLPVAAGRVLREEAGIGQLAQRPMQICKLYAGQRGHCGRGDVATRDETQQPAW